MIEESKNYQSGFGNYFESEAVEGGLPQACNSPQRHKLGLYPEQISGTAFTRPRRENLRSWLYRIRPSVSQGQYVLYDSTLLLSPPFSDKPADPNQIRWSPRCYPSDPCDFLSSLTTWIGHGSPQSMEGGVVHLYACNESMKNDFFSSSDGDMLIVPQEGALSLATEFGNIDIDAGMIAVIPRGIKFQVKLQNDRARGYVLENFGEAFDLPDLGPIGANGLANPRDFQYPIASYSDYQANFRLILKFQGRLWQSQQNHNPLDVVAWHGNYAPYRYDLQNFNTIGTISYDHPDPSIFTVLSSKTSISGFANIDFVIFPERWLVAENTFRPPYFHKNLMSEYMGLIYGGYDAKSDDFSPGGGSLHNCMSPHGPDLKTFEKASQSPSTPQKIKASLAFMFESKNVWQMTAAAENGLERQHNYHKCWQGLNSKFTQRNSQIP